MSGNDSIVEAKEGTASVKMRFPVWIVLPIFNCPGSNAALTHDARSRRVRSLLLKTFGVGLACCGVRVIGL